MSANQYSGVRAGQERKGQGAGRPGVGALGRGRGTEIVKIFREKRITSRLSVSDISAVR